MSQQAHLVDEDDKAIIESGHKPELRRGLGFFSSFAIAFSYMSVLTGIFANYGFVLNKAGPFGIWTWVIVSIGHTLVALVFAELAGRMPLTGCSYNWNTKLNGPTFGWLSGWLALLAYTIGVAAVTATIVPVLNVLLDMQIDPATAKYIGVGLVLLQAAFNIYSVRAAAFLNVGAVVAEIAALIIFGLLIGGALLLKGEANVGLITSIPTEPQSYWAGFMIACLMGSWTLLGFEGSADIAEETVNARSVAPKSIIQSVLAASLLGFAFILLLTFAITDVAGVSGAANPATAIIASVLGEPLAKVFLVLVLIAFFACSLVNMTGASRVLFAMSRDNRFVASKAFKRVSQHQVPKNAIWAIAIVAAGFLYMADFVTSLYGAGAVLFTLFYLSTVVGYAKASKRLPATDTFTLGKWRGVVVTLATIWLIAEIGILTIPEEFHEVAQVSIGVTVAGALIYLIAGRRIAARIS